MCASWLSNSPLLQQAYTPDGLIASLTDANSNTTAFTPDGFDRLSTTTYPGGSTESLAYDADGNVLTRKTRAGATITFTYDTLNRLSTKAAPSEPSVTYAYDQASHLIGVSDNSSAITAPAASASYAASYAYDQLNRPLTASWSPAPTQTMPAATTATFNFGYDATNRRISQTVTDNSWWSYPTTATNIGYTANNLNQYTAVGSVSPSYDGNGNLSSDGTFSYCYDAENRLVSILTAGTCSSPTTALASYAYDTQGRRKSKAAGGTATIYVTDSANREVLEYNGTSGALNNWYSFAPAAAFGPDAVINQMSVTAATRGTLVPDVQGSIIGSLDATSATLTKTGYQTYGENPTLASGAYQYTARRFDTETAGSASQPSGLYYYRARMYSPTWGRYMQVDPIGYAGGANLYAYVANDPLNGEDPNGLLTLTLGVTGSLYAGTGGQAFFGLALSFPVPYFDPGAKFDVGGYYGAGGGVGVEIGTSVSAGAYIGDITNGGLNGPSISTSGGILGIGGQGNFGLNGNLTGLSASIGDRLPVPIFGNTSYIYTSVFSFRQTSTNLWNQLSSSYSTLGASGSAPGGNALLGGDFQGDTISTGFDNSAVSAGTDNSTVTLASPPSSTNASDLAASSGK